MDAPLSCGIKDVPSAKQNGFVYFSENKVRHHLYKKHLIPHNFWWCQPEQKIQFHLLMSPYFYRKIFKFSNIYRYFPKIFQRPIICNRITITIITLFTGLSVHPPIENAAQHLESCHSYKTGSGIFTCPCWNT